MEHATSRYFDAGSSSNSAFQACWAQHAYVCFCKNIIGILIIIYRKYFSLVSFATNPVLFTTSTPMEKVLEKRNASAVLHIAKDV